MRLLTEYLPPETFGGYKLALAGVSLIAGIGVRPFIQYAMRAYHDAAVSGGLHRFLTRSARSFGAYVAALGLAVAAAGWVLTRGGGGLGPAVPALLGAVLALQALVERDRALSVTRGRQGAAESVGVGLAWLIPVAVAGSVLVGGSLSVVLAAHAGALGLLLLAPRLAHGRGTGGDRGAPGAADAVDATGAAGSAWTYAWPLVAAGCLSWLAHESDRFILGYYHGAGAVGLYAAAYGLASAPFTAAAGAAAQVMLPVAFAASARAGGDAVPAAPRSVFAGALLVGAGGVCVVWLAGDRIAGLLLAESYRAAAPDLMVWIALGYACFGAAMCLDLAAFGAKRTVFVMIASGAAAVTNVGLDLLLVPARGATGAAVATAAALCVYLLCMAGLLRAAQPGRAAGAGTQRAGAEREHG
ncbi:MAG: polysaccharide biosynthesis C-terminal domain-containing protein [Acidobacteria bacterium]|nr:polysaccharide biosynthesis C-terminal domain-containing protein [Acidobacteriota bacterium]